MNNQLNTTLNKNMSIKDNRENTQPNVLYINREEDRLKTYDSWTKEDVDKYKLAKYGFRYKGPEDTVECVYCKVMIAGWGYGDDPLREHIHWSPSCPFLLHKAPVNVAIEPNFETQLPSPEYFVPIVYDADDPTDLKQRATHKIVLTGPIASRHPAYISYEKRIQSFANWPKSLKQDPRVLSEAGLFYLGKSDHVKCFSCGGALRDWDQDDDPWHEHAKHFGHCDHVKQYKSAQFIEQAQNPMEESDMESDDDNDDSVSDKLDIDEEMSASDDDSTTSAKCNICVVNDLDAIFLPCMHVYTCVKCGFSVTHCPVCRQKIIDLKKCYLGQLSQIREQSTQELEFNKPTSSKMFSDRACFIV